MKTEVYSWRVSTDLKTGLEFEARRRKISLSAVLDLAAQEWLSKSGAGNDNEEEQRRLQQAAAKCLGVFASGESGRSEKARQAVRQRLRRRYGR
ncbi:MAG: hypothetical protein ABI165_11360 [Bryobacteraceae bacterium]